MPTFTQLFMKELGLYVIKFSPCSYSVPCSASWSPTPEQRIPSLTGLCANSAIAMQFSP